MIGSNLSLVKTEQCAHLPHESVHILSPYFVILMISHEFNT